MAHAKLAGMRTLFLVATMLASSLHAAEPAQHPDAVSQWQKAYPAAAKGMKRIVIHLEAKSDEFAWKVELSAGRTIETDGVNHVGGGARIVEKTVEGWGYNYFEVSAAGPMFSTKIGVPADQPKVTRFVTMAKTDPVRYNSKLPVIIYAPADMEIRYRLWQAEPEARKGEEG